MWSSVSAILCAAACLQSVASLAVDIGRGGLRCYFQDYAVGSRIQISYEVITSTTEDFGIRVCV